MIDLSFTISRLLPVLPHLLISFISVLILTPVISRIAYKLKALDLKVVSGIRTSNFENVENLIPRLGGLGVSLVFTILMFLVYGFNSFTILLGISILILTVAGLLDDIYDLPAWMQFCFQLIAVALIVIVGGVRIENIQIANFSLNFIGIEYFFNVFEILFKVVFPADIITIFWIMIIINAMNWVAGIDALEELMSIIAGFTLVFIAIKLNKLEFIPLIAIYTGSLMGFTIFNLPPAKVYSGTIGNIIYGFLLSVLAIKIDGKMTTSILLLAIPLVDFIWVLLGRLVKYKVYNPVKLMSISGNHHLHHRLGEMNFSTWQILAIELSLFLMFASLAYFSAGFDIAVVAGIFSFATLVVLFGLLSYKSKRKNNIRTEKISEIKRETEIKQTPDREYRY